MIQGLKTNLLGLPAITSLQLVYRVEEMICDARQDFQVCFKDWEPYQIKLKEDAVPYSLYTPRNVVIPLREKVKMELNQMETNGIIYHPGVPG